MPLIRGMIVASFLMAVTPFYENLFSAVVQFSAKSLMPMLLSTLGISS